VRTARQLGQQQEAFNISQGGRKLFPHDPELLFHEGQLRREGGDLAGAERALVQLLTQQPETYIAAGIDPGLQGFKGRCALAEVFRDQGRLADAETQWRAALAEQPDFTVAWLSMADMWLAQGNWERADQIA